MTDNENKKAGELIASAEIAVGELTPRNEGNAVLIKEILQSLNGLRALLGLTRPVH
jgi:hypothetical protein